MPYVCMYHACIFHIYVYNMYLYVICMCNDALHVQYYICVVMQEYAICISNKHEYYVLNASLHAYIPHNFFVGFFYLED